MKKLLFIAVLVAAAASSVHRAGAMSIEQEAMEKYFSDTPGCQGVDWARVPSIDACHDFDTNPGSTCDEPCKGFMKALGPNCFRGMAQATAARMNLNIPTEKTGAAADATYKSCMAGSPSPALKDTRESIDMAATAFSNIKGCENVNWTAYGNAVANNPKGADECLADLERQEQLEGDITYCPQTCGFVSTVSVDCWVGIFRQVASGFDLQLSDNTLRAVEERMRKLRSVCRPATGGAAGTALGAAALRAIVATAAAAVALLAMLA